MTKFLIQRLVQLIIVLFLISLIVFGLIHVAGDPVALMMPIGSTQEEIEIFRESLGLNKPFLVQYWIFFQNMLQDDFGQSFRYNSAALPIVLERLPATFELAFASMIVATIISVPLGIWSATRRNSFLDLFITGGSVLGKAMPNFWLGIMLILLFSVSFQIFPVSGRGSIEHLILPAVTLGTAVAATMTRLIRSSMLEVLNQDYVRTAKSKGLRDFFVIYKHAFRNTLIPVITIIALQVSTLVSGALITETVFAWPGLGQLIVQAVNGRDMAIVQAAVFVVATIVVLINLITDLLYRVIDPRIKFK
ncbi:ABC transporter permease [Brevibacillus sp. B_LB10_24]|uniref:ABC transporter permease n=1 Tax=Brevibacillus sp. B_LB10_24 TaxID=3380645 RepID=UPI0038BAEE3E